MLYNKDWAYKLNPVADTLLKAADLLEKRGHTKHIRLDGAGRMCFLGAVAVAQGQESGWLLGERGGDSKITHEAARAVVDSLGLKPRRLLTDKGDERDYRGVMVDWNNKTERTGQEVIDAMRQTASQLLEKEKVHAV